MRLYYVTKYYRIAGSLGWLISCAYCWGALRDGRRSLAVFPVVEFLWLVLLPLVLAVAVVDCLTQSPAQRVRRLNRSGLSQRAIASRTGLTRYRVRQLLAV